MKPTCEIYNQDCIAGRLRGYGNAIVPQLAAMFVRAFLETEVEANYKEQAATRRRKNA
jgi:hypothetical protein